MRASVVVLLAIILAPSARAQAPAPALPLDLSRFVSRTDSFAVMVRGNQIGFIRSALEPGADRFTYTEVSSIAGLIEQSTTLVLDAKGAVKSVRQSGKVQGEPTSIELEYAAGRVKGRANTIVNDSTKSVVVDTTIPPGTLDDSAIQAILPALALGPDKSWQVGFFVGAASEYRVTTVKVAATDRAVIGADTVATYRVDWTGVTTPTTFWVTTTPPYRILKIVLVGAPLEIVRVGGRP